MKKALLLAVATLPLFLTNCAPKLGGNDYSMADVGANSLSLRGTIVAMRAININASQPNQPGVGAAVGAVSGAALGSTIGQGKGSLISTVIGGLAGGAAGHFIEQGATSQEGFEYTVELENGQIQTIAQGAEPRMSVGQKVIVVLNNKGVSGQGARSRVIPDTSGY